MPSNVTTIVRMWSVTALLVESQPNADLIAGLVFWSLMDEGKLRNDLPVERLLDTVGSLLYGTMFTNYFIWRSVTLAEQYEAIIQVVFRGILSDSERRKRAPSTR